MNGTSNSKHTAKFKCYLPLYYICVSKRRISRSTHCRATNPICFWTAYSWRMSLFWSHSISSTTSRERRQNVLGLLSALIYRFVLFHKWWVVNKKWHNYSKFPYFLNMLLFPIHWIQGQRPGTWPVYTIFVHIYICFISCIN